MNDGGWTEANVVAAAVRILGGAQNVADSLGVSRSQVYRWIKARSMARATYIHVAKLASLSGIDTGFLGGDGSQLPGIRESVPKEPLQPLKPGSVHSPAAIRTHRLSHLSTRASARPIQVFTQRSNEDEMARIARSTHLRRTTRSD
jgi:DNA-binding phage protein